LTEKVADDLPEAIDTDAGTVAALVSLDKVTMTPLGGADPLSVTVPVAVPPPTVDPGLTVIETRLIGLIVKFADCEVLPVVPVIMATIWLATALVVTVKLAETAPIGILMLAGTFAFEVLLAS